MWRVLVVVAFAAACPARVGAQTLPSGPVTAFDGRLSVGGEVAATIGEEDHVAYFNYTDYEHNALRMLRLSLAAAWQPLDRVALVGEIRTEDLSNVRPYAAYIRVRPAARLPLDIQAGQIPPSFGAYGRRGYQGSDNTLIGYPLAYQYLTPLRPDALPATPADLLAMRARGWRVTYPIGSSAPAPGVPLISAFRWDTGVQAHWQGRVLDATAGVTVGTLSNPQGGDNNDGKQVSGRFGVRPTAGLVLGVSGARGAFLAESVTRLMPGGRGDYNQSALGADGEYSRGHWLVRGEIVWSRWNVPFRIQPDAPVDLDALGAWIEGRYRVTPRIVLSTRADRLDFSRIDAGPDFSPTWDAPLSRVEATAGYYVQRNLVLRLGVQHNERDGGRVRSRTLVSGQVAYWF
jgi:hypothetical protein